MLVTHHAAAGSTVRVHATATQGTALVHKNIIPNSGNMYKINVIPLVSQTLGNFLCFLLEMACE